MPRKVRRPPTFRATRDLAARIAGTSATLIFVAYFIYLSVESLAGRETLLKAMVNGVLDARIDKYLAWVVAAVSSGGYIHERRLRRRTISGSAEHVRSLEEKIDPTRSRSGLTKTGQPKKEDLDVL